MNEWEKSHARWWAADDLRLQKLNYHRGIGVAETGDVARVPLELRHLLPENPDSHLESEGLGFSGLADPHPGDQFFQKLALDSLIHATPTSPENDGVDWLSKLLALPAADQHHERDGEPLAKGEVQSRLTSLLHKIRANAAELGVAIDFEGMEKAIRCLDIAAFGELAEAAVGKIQTAAHALAA
jgi:hypothetical protein